MKARQHVEIGVMTDKTVIDNDEDMAAVALYSREKRIRIGILLVLLPALTVCLWIIGLRMPAASFNTLSGELFIACCYIALFLTIVFPHTLPELPFTVRLPYSLVWLTGLVSLLSYCVRTMHGSICHGQCRSIMNCSGMMGRRPH